MTRAGRKASVALLAAAVFLFALIGQTGWGLERSLFCANFYSELSREMELPALVHSHMLERLFAGAGSELPPDSLLRRAVAAAASPEWLEQQLESAAGELLALIKGERESLRLAVDLRQRKDIFKRELVGGLSKARLEKLELTGSFVDSLIEQAGFPDELLLEDLTPAAGAISGAAAALRQVRRGRVFYRVGPCLALGALLLLCCYRAGPGRGALFFGGGLFAGGLCGLLVLCAGAHLLPALEPLFLPLFPGEWGAFVSANPGLVTSSARIIRQTLFEVPCLTALFGLVLILVGLLISDRIRFPRTDRVS